MDVEHLAETHQGLVIWQESAIFPTRYGALTGTHFLGECDLSQAGGLAQRAQLFTKRIGAVFHGERDATPKAPRVANLGHNSP